MDFDEKPEALPIDDHGEEDDVFMDEEEEPAVEEEAPDETGEETADEDAFGGTMEGDAEDEEPLFEDENPEETGETPDDTEEMMLEEDEDLSPDEIPNDMFVSSVDEESLEEEFPEENIQAEIPEEESFEEESFKEEIPAEESTEEEITASEIPASESAVPGTDVPPETIPSSVEGIKSVAVSDMLGLMNYLKDLSKSLPEKERKTFVQSDVRVSMEYLIDTMEGHKGLRKDIEDRHTISTEGAPGKASLSGTLGYLKKLAGALPDQDLGEAVSRKLETVISALEKKTHG